MQFLLSGRGLLTLIGVLWVLHVILPQIFMSHQLYSLIDKDMATILTLIMDGMIKTPHLLVLPMTTWLVSLCISRKIGELYGELKRDQNVDTLAMVRKQYVQIKDMISDLDNGLKPVLNIQYIVSYK